MSASIPNRRSAHRTPIEPLRVSSVCALETLSKICREAEVVEASSTGFRVVVPRKELVPLHLRQSLSLESLVGERILLHFPQMELEMSGTITRTSRTDKDHFELGVDFSEDAPDYWRDCLMELLPRPGELD